MKFAATMAGMNDMPGGMKVTEAMVQPMFMAQCLKDDAMAESIADYLDTHGDASCIMSSVISTAKAIWEP